MITERTESCSSAVEVYRAVLTRINDGETEVFVALRETNDSWNAGRWEFIGGKREPDQTPTEALVQEVLQEVGLVVTPIGETFYEESETYTEGPRKGSTYTLRAYMCDITGGKIKRGSEHDDCNWFPISRAVEMDLTQQSRNVLNALLEKTQPSNPQDFGVK